MADVDYGLLEACVKKDAAAYRDDFLKRYRHFDSEYEVFMLKPPKGDAENKAFGKLVQFVGFCSDSYPEDVAGFAEKLGALLEKHLNVLNHSLRATVVRTLIVMRNKNQLQPTDLLALFFKLFRCHDKSLRTTLYNHIVADITNVNRRRRDNALNRTLVNFMYTMLEDQDPTAAKKSLEVMIELYKRGVWTDAKTVNAIAGCVFSPFTKMRVAALQFFLNIDSDLEQRQAVMESKINLEKETRRHVVTRKTRAKVKKFKAAQEEHKRMLRGEGAAAPARPNWPAIELVFDPHGYAKKLLGLLKHSTDGFDVRLMLMNFISRLIAAHKIILVAFYPFMQRYLKPRQNKVTHLLAIVAQASHELVPPDVLQPVVRTIANEFIHEGSAEEIVATGMNALQAICRRCPLVMDQDLLRDLALYKSSRDRAVMASARSLIQLYRETNPALLARRDRGRGTKDVEVAAYGEEKVSDDVEGIELLQLVKDILAGKIHSEAAGKDVETSDEEDEDDDDEEENVEEEDDEDDEDEDDDDEEEDEEEDEDKDEDEDKEDGDEDDEETEIPGWELASDDENEEEGEEEDEDGEGEWKKADDDDDGSTIEVSEDEEEDEDEDDDDEDDEDDDEDEDEDEEDDGKAKKRKREGSDDEEEEGKEKKKQRKEEKDEKEQEVSHVPLHILSQTDLMLLQKLKKLAAEDPLFIKSLKKMSRFEVKKLSRSKAESDSDEEEEEGENGQQMYVTPEEIAAKIKSKMTRQEREAALAAARQSSKESRQQHKITRGRSKKVVARNKNFLMKMIGQRTKRARERKAKRTKDRQRAKRFHGRLRKRFGKKQGR